MKQIKLDLEHLNRNNYQQLLKPTHPNKSHSFCQEPKYPRNYTNNRAPIEKINLENQQEIKTENL
jgi:hypothetical protein